MGTSHSCGGRLAGRAPWIARAASNIACHEAATCGLERRLRVRSSGIPRSLTLRVDLRLECQQDAIELAHHRETRRPGRRLRRRLPATLELDRDGLRKAACLSRVAALNGFIERLAQLGVSSRVGVADRPEHGFEGVAGVVANSSKVAGAAGEAASAGRPPR